MTCRKQHFIPQFLQKNFSDNATHIWVYTKNNIYCNPIKDSAEQNDFYSKPGDIQNTDKVFTGFEGSQASLLEKLISLPDSYTINFSNDLKHFILTLLYRTRSFRKNILEASSILLKEKMIKDVKHVHKSILYKKFSVDKIKDRNKKIKAKLNVDNFVESIYKTYEYFIEHNLSNIIRDSHNNILFKNEYEENDLIDPNSLITIIEKQEEIILGDSVILFKISDKGKEIYKNIPTDKDSKIENIIMPISKNKLLIFGENPNHFKNIDINIKIAECSDEKFFASKNIQSFVSLQKYIGSSSNFFTEEEYDEIIQDLIKDMEKRNN